MYVYVVCAFRMGEKNREISFVLFLTSTDFDLMPSHTPNDISNLLDEAFFVYCRTFVWLIEKEGRACCAHLLVMLGLLACCILHSVSNVFLK